MRGDIRRRIESLEERQIRTNREISALKEQLRREEQGQFVRVMFHGHAKEYCYEVPEPFVGRVEVGDYMSVWSPMTDKDEIVKVVALGRGRWMHGTKTARPIRWSVDMEIPF